jgi:outer membrane receptor for ferrienterochelin and colicin
LAGLGVPAFNPLGDGSINTKATIDSFRSQSDFFARTRLWTMNAQAERRLLKLRGEDVVLQTGLQFQAESLDTQTHASKSSPVVPMDLARQIASTYGELRVPIFASITVVASGRLDHYSDFGTS